MLVIFSNITEATFVLKCRLNPAVHLLCRLLNLTQTGLSDQSLVRSSARSPHVISTKSMFDRFPASSAFLSVVNNVSGAHVM